MAGDGDGEWVRATRLSDRPHGSVLAYPLCDFGITDRRAGRDLQQRVPHPDLERGASDVEREGKANGRVFDESDNLGDPPIEGLVAADQISL